MTNLFQDEWFYILQQVEIYIIENNKLPSITDKKDKVKKLRLWLCCQRQNYKENTRMMNDNTKKHTWENFIEKYKEFI